MIKNLLDYLSELKARFENCNTEIIRNNVEEPPRVVGWEVNFRT